MLQILLKLKSRLNSLPLHGDVKHEKQQNEHEVLRQWIQERREEMNAYYKRERDYFPSMDVNAYKDSGIHINEYHILEAWVNSTRDMMDLFYQDEENKIPFPSLKPPGNSIAEWATEKVCDYYGDGMPWPGYWAFSQDQIDVFGTPETCEIGFRRLGNRRAYVVSDYMEELVDSFRDVQEAVIKWRGVSVSTPVIDFWLNKRVADDLLQITFIKVRPCMQNQGLFTIFLFITIDACIRNGKYRLGVHKAIPSTERMLLGYGFKTVEVTEDSKANMLLDGEDAMNEALKELKKKKAVQKVRNLNSLYSQMDDAFPNDDDSTFRELRYTYDFFFKQRIYNDPEHVYYLDFADFPTAAQLRNPEYVQARFPKPNHPLPTRYAPSQSPGSDTMDTSS